MNKEAFLTELRVRLSSLPDNEAEERISFYREMIDERMADGQTEEDAVAGIGSIDEIVEQITAEIPLAVLVRGKASQRKGMKGWEIALLILGAPLWIPLLIAALAILLTVYIVLWAVIISLWAADLGLAAAAVASLVSVVPYLRAGNLAGVGVAVGAALICAGLAVLMFHACVCLTRAVIQLMGKILLGVKTLFMGKGA